MRMLRRIRTTAALVAATVGLTACDGGVSSPDGESGLERMRERDPRAVLLDVGLPGIDGFEATRQIRAFRDAATLPIVALTAYASSIEREMSESCGMNGYLTKPIVLEELVETLSAWLPESDDTSPADADAVQQGDAPAVDEAALAELADQIGHANLIAVINKFLEEIDTRWSALEQANTNVDRAREAHTLASTCQSFGLPSIGEKIACIERHAKFGGQAGEPPLFALQETQARLGPRH